MKCDGPTPLEELDPNLPNQKHCKGKGKMSETLKSEK